MRRWRSSRRARLLGVGGGLLFLAAVATVLARGHTDGGAAPPEALARIDARNRDAAAEAAARMKAESEAATRAAEARLAVAERNDAAGESGTAAR